MKHTIPAILASFLCWFSIPAWGQSNGACDLAAPYGTIDGGDVQAAIDMTLGTVPCTANIAGSGVCNVVVVQRVVNASLPGGLCKTGTGSHSVSLNWNASSSSGISGYNVYRSTTSGKSYTKLNPTPVSGLTYTDTTVANGATYYYVTTAVSSSSQESTYSNEAPATIPSS